MVEVSLGGFEGLRLVGNGVACVACGGGALYGWLYGYLSESPICRASPAVGKGAAVFVHVSYPYASLLYACCVCGSPSVFVSCEHAHAPPMGRLAVQPL